MSIIFSNSGKNPVSLSTKLYSDGTPLIKTDKWQELLDADTLTVRADSLLEFIEAMFVYDAVLWAGGKTKKLVLPYIPGARQDRTNVEGDILFTARSVANEIGSRGFSRILVLDPHSPVFKKYLPGAFEYPLDRIAERIPGEYDGIVSTDKGGKDRAQVFADALGLPIIHASKERDVSTGRLTNFLIEVPMTGYLQDSNLLVVDDICDGGGTFNGLAEKIHEQGATADLYVTHGIFAKGTEELKKNYGEIYTTNSHYVNERNDVKMIPIITDMEAYNEF